MGGVFLLLIIVNTGLHAVKMVFPPIAVIYSMRYNAPMTLLSSVCFFSWALTWRMQSRFINRVAKSVLSVYIISELVPKVYYDALHWIQNNMSLSTELVMVPVYIVVFFCACVLFDQVRLWFQNRLTPSVMLIVYRVSDYITLNLRNE